MIRRLFKLAAVGLWLGLTGAAIPTAATAETVAEATAPAPTPTVLEMADWVVRSGDNQGLPFAIIDKSSAVVSVFDPRGRLIGADVALLGLTVGDDSVPGIGDRALSQVRPEDRTTPAGRFLGGYGPADGGREVLWVDFATAVSMHPVVTSNPKEMRLERLKSPTINDNRISYGCINVFDAFYDGVVEPTFRKSNGVFYVLPDTKTLAEVFPDFAGEARRRAELDARASQAHRGWRRLFDWW